MALIANLSLKRLKNSVIVDIICRPRFIMKNKTKKYYKFNQRY